MREIKFRAYDSHYKYMNYKVLVGIYGEWEKVKDDENYTACSMWIEPEKVDYKCEPHWTHFEPYHKDIHLMQYTGLKDKNGKEIYEGDIVAEKGHYVNSDRLVYQKIQWKENYSCWLRGEYQRLTPKNIKTYQIEVVGNIYDNPELLHN